MMIQGRARIFRLVQLVVLSATILWLSITSTPPQIEHSFWGWDKAQHALAYGVLSLVAGRLFSLLDFSARTVWGIAFVYAVGFGGLVEVLQGVAGTGRVCEWGDLLADALGALVVCAVGLLTHEGKISRISFSRR